MKSHFKLFLSFLSIACIAFTLTACGGDSHSHEGHDHSKEEKHEGHDHNHDGHNHNHDGHNHDGHNHDHDHNHDGHNHDHEGHDHNHGEKDGASTVDMSAPEYASAYICPMHCKGSGSNKAGICPTCKMEYALNAEHKEDGHIH